MQVLDFVEFALAAKHRQHGRSTTEPPNSRLKLSLTKHLTTKSIYDDRISLT